MQAKDLLLGELDADKHASERVMLERVLDKTKTFYKDPNNIQAFTAWKKNREEMPNGANTNNS